MKLAQKEQQRLDGGARAEQEAEQLETLGKILSQAGTQLRMPLGNITSALARLAPMERREEDPALDALAALVEQSCCRLMRLVGNLTDAATLWEDGPLPLCDDDLVALCREVCWQVETIAEMRGLRLQFVCGEEQHLVAINGEAIERLLRNLLSNAIKFTPRGGEVRVGITSGGEMLELWVEDTGCGIAPELLPTLFDRYRHFDRMDPPPHGLGLGLPLCQRIAAGHGGTMDATSAPGVGSRFTLRLPDRRVGVSRLRDSGADRYGGFNPTLLELSDAAPPVAYRCRYMD